VERGSGFRQSDLQAEARQKDERDVKQIAMQTSEKLQLFTGAKFFPTSDESPVSHSIYSRGRGIAWEYFASVTLVGVRELCGCGNVAVGQGSSKI